MNKASAWTEMVQTDGKLLENLEDNVDNKKNAITDGAEGNDAKEVVAFLKMEISSLNLKARMKKQKRIKQK